MKKQFITVLLGVFIAFIFYSFKHSEQTKPNIESSSFYTTKKLEAKIIQAVPQGKKTVIVLNKGSKFKIRTGDSGVIPALNDIQFKITETYSFRSKALIDTVISQPNLKVFINVQDN